MIANYVRGMMEVQETWGWSCRIMVYFEKIQNGRQVVTVSFTSIYKSELYKTQFINHGYVQMALSPYTVTNW